MVTKYHIWLLIEECRELGSSGLNNGIKASIPKLELDVVHPPKDFLGVHGNPAIFVNEKTYKLWGAHHEDWIQNKTIAIKESFLKKSPIEIIGAIIHETGHAFNVAAKIKNTEANAYIYEIEVMRKLLETNSPLLLGCSYDDLQLYFKSRLPFYKQGVPGNEYLAKLVADIKSQFKLEEPIVPTPKISTVKIRFFEVSPFVTKVWDKEYQIITSKL